MKHVVLQKIPCRDVIICVKWIGLVSKDILCIPSNLHLPNVQTLTTESTMKLQATISSESTMFAMGLHWATSISSCTYRDMVSTYSFTTTLSQCNTKYRHHTHRVPDPVSVLCKVAHNVLYEFISLLQSNKKTCSHQYILDMKHHMLNKMQLLTELLKF